MNKCIFYAEFYFLKFHNQEFVKGGYKKFLKKISGIIVVVIIGFFLINSLIENWEKIKSYDFDIKIGYLILSLILISISVFLGSFLWRKILKTINGDSFDVFTAFKIHISSWLCKYIPGKVSSILMKVYLSNKEGFSKKELFITVVYENIFVILSAFIVGIPVIILSLNELINKSEMYLIVFSVLVICGFLFIYTDLFYFVINFLLKKAKFQMIDKKYFLNNFNITKMLFYYILFWLFIGFSFTIFIYSFTDINIFDFIFYSGVFSLAAVLGLLAIFAPSGIGVREGIMAIFLVNFFPIEIALFISISARIWVSISDAVLASFLPFLKLKTEKVTTTDN